MPSRVVSAQLTAQERLRQFAVKGVTLRWNGLAGYDEEDIEGWLAAVVPLILAAERQSVLITDAYVARMLGRQPLGLNAVEIINAIRGNVSTYQVYRRPFVTVWAALSRGTPYENAVAAGLARAQATARMDVQLAHRAALQSVQEREPRIRGWKRAADDGACEYCVRLNGAFVRSANAMPLHAGCGCGLEPVESVQRETPIPDGVAIHEHGEYGPTIADPNHKFSGAHAAE